MNKFTLGGIATAIALAASPAAHATVYTIDEPAKERGYFFTTDAAPDYSTVTANFGKTVTPSTFDDTFQFILPKSGVGSGSLSTTFTSDLNTFNITDVIITTLAGTFTYGASDFKVEPNGLTLVSDLIPIVGSTTFFNTIQVKGTAIGTGSYSGIVSFAAAVPEASTWALMIFGVGAVGFAARRSRKTAVRVTYA